MTKKVEQVNGHSHIFSLTRVNGYADYTQDDQFVSHGSNWITGLHIDKANNLLIATTRFDYFIWNLQGDLIRWVKGEDYNLHWSEARQERMRINDSTYKYPFIASGAHGWSNGGGGIEVYNIETDTLQATLRRGSLPYSDTVARSETVESLDFLDDYKIAVSGTFSGRGFTDFAGNYHTISGGFGWNQVRTFPGNIAVYRMETGAGGAGSTAVAIYTNPHIVPPGQLGYDDYKFYPNFEGSASEPSLYRSVSTTGTLTTYNMAGAIYSTYYNAVLAETSQNRINYEIIPYDHNTTNNDKIVAWHADPGDPDQKPDIIIPEYANSSRDDQTFRAMKLYHNYLMFSTTDSLRFLDLETMTETYNMPLNRRQQWIAQDEEYLAVSQDTPGLTGTTFNIELYNVDWEISESKGRRVLNELYNVPHIKKTGQVMTGRRG